MFPDRISDEELYIWSMFTCDNMAFDTCYPVWECLRPMRFFALTHRRVFCRVFPPIYKRTLSRPKIIAGDISRQ